MTPRLSAIAFLGLFGLSTAMPAAAQPASCDFDDIAVLATNSIDIKDEAKVLSGGVFVNEASPGPTLVSGVELNLRKKAQVGDISADSIAIAGEVVVSGSAFCNDLSDSTGTVACSPLALPVFPVLPTFHEATVRSEAVDVVVAPATTVVLAEGDYRDITVNPFGVVVFSGGIYNVQSISTTDDAQVLFDAPAQVRVVGKVGTGKRNTIGPNVGAAISAADIVLYVGGINGTSGGITAKPAAVELKDVNTVAANIYAPRGRVQVAKESAVTGAVLAADIHLDKKVTVALDSAFANQPPVADAKDVTTDSLPSIDIVLSGGDPEGGPLTFVVETLPLSGTLTHSGSIAVAAGVPLPGPIVTYTPTVQAANVEDSFEYTVTDDCGDKSAPAEVRINAPGDPTTPPAPLGEVVANDKTLETIQDTAKTITLTAAAPCDGPCDGVGNDVPLTFSLPSATTSGGGTLTNLTPGTGVPQRTASVLYTPLAGFIGADSFSFTVVGDVDDNTIIDPAPDPGNPERDTGLVNISVQVFAPLPPVEGMDQIVSTPMDTPVIVNLSGGGDTCPPGDEVCHEGGGGAAPLLTGAAVQAVSAGASFVDDTGTSGQQAGAPRVTRVATGTSDPLTNAARPGERLFALDSDLDQLFEVNPANGSSALVGSTASGPSTPSSLAFDGTKMYSIDLGAGGLYTLNVDTGVPTFVCTTGISGWQGLASDPTDEGQLYGITQSDDLYRIDRFTCATTQVNTAPVGGLIAALEFDTDGTLWGAEFGSPGSTSENAGLVTIDKTTGAVTVVSQCATRPCGGGDNFLDGFQGIDFSTDGTLYGANTNNDSLYIIDTTDGSVTLLGAHGTTIFVKGLSFSEEVLFEPGFTITSLPSVGTLSYLSPATGLQTTILSGDLPLLLATDEVTYTPPAGQVSDPPTAPLASFMFQVSDGFTSATGLIELVITGEIIIVDACLAVGRPPGCDPETLAAGGDEGSGERRVELPLTDTLRGPTLTLVVEGPGSVSSNPRRYLGDELLGLLCGANSVCRLKFPQGTELTLQARPDDGASRFVGWAGQCEGDLDISDALALNGDRVCRAVFESIEK